ncbi:MAG TPA: nitroreductase [Chloroflexota bacterium]|nr:nitroreductase [Chloroflexota bacterium]
MMDVMEAIRTRRSIAKTQPRLPSRELIEEVLEAATWAPNHYLNQPWRFFVLGGAARERFGEVLAEDACRALSNLSPEQREAVAEAQRAKAVRAPVIVTVAVEPPVGPKIVDVENVCAAACAIQNLLLAAHARGLAIKWSTGPAARSELVKRFFGLSPEHQILAFLYLGYPAEEPPAASRAAVHEKTTWLGWSADGQHHSS